MDKTYVAVCSVRRLKKVRGKLMEKIYEMNFGLAPSDHTYTQRVAVRGIAVKNNKVLMITTKLGDCMFPGGGMDLGESEIDTLKREVEEESGYRCKEVGAYVCISHERKEDKFKPGTYIDLISKYYICTVEDKMTHQCLDAYERDLEFKGTWLDYDGAIQMNLDYRAKAKIKDFWRLRTLRILEMIKNGLIDSPLMERG